MILQTLFRFLRTLYVKNMIQFAPRPKALSIRGTALPSVVQSPEFRMLLFGGVTSPKKTHVRDEPQKQPLVSFFWVVFRRTIR